MTLIDKSIVHFLRGKQNKIKVGLELKGNNMIITKEITEPAKTRSTLRFDLSNPWNDLPFFFPALEFELNCFRFDWSLLINLVSFRLFYSSCFWFECRVLIVQMIGLWIFHLFLLVRPKLHFYILSAFTTTVLLFLLFLLVLARDFGSFLSVLSGWEGFIFHF